MATGNRRIQGITLAIGGDTTEIEIALKNVNSEVRVLERELSGVNAALRLDPDNVNLLAARSEILTNNIQSLNQRLEVLRENQEQVNSGFDRTGRALEAGEIRRYNTEVETAASSIRNLETQLARNNARLEEASAANNQASNAVVNFLSSINDSIDSLNIFGSVLQANIASELVVGGIQFMASAIKDFASDTVQAGIDFESAFAGVVKTVDGTATEILNLRAGLRELATEIPASTVAISAVGEAAGQLGIEVENILDFSQVMIALGESTNIGAEEAAKALAQFANITGMSQQEFDKLGSSIVALGNNFATTERDIVNMAQRLAGAGNQAGFTESEILAISTALSSLGINAEAGGSAISKTISNIQVAVETNSKKLQEFADIAGMSAEQFRRAFEENAAGAFDAFITGLAKSEEQGRSTIVTLEDLGITEIRQRDALLRLASASGILTDALATSRTAWAENVALQNEVSIRYGTTESQLQLVGNAATELAMVFSEQLLPGIQLGAQSLTSFLLSAGDGLEGLAKLAGSTFYVIVDNIELFIAALGALGAALGFVKVQAMMAAGTLATIFSPVALIGGAIAAVVVAFGALRNAAVEAEEKARLFREECLNAADTLEELQAAAAKAENDLAIGTETIAKYRELKGAVDDATLSIAERAAKQEELGKVEQELIALSNGLITQASLESGAIDNLLPVLERQLEIRKEMARFEEEVFLNTHSLEVIQMQREMIQAEMDDIKESFEEIAAAYDDIGILAVEYNRHVKDNTLYTQEGEKAALALADAIREQGIYVSDNAAYYDDLNVYVEQYNEKVAETTEKYNETNQALVEIMATEERYVAIMAAAAAATEDMGDGVDDAKEKMEALRNILNAMNHIIDTSTEKIGDLSGGFDILESATKEYNDTGGLSIDTIQTLMALGSDYINLLQLQGGQLSINTEAVNENNQALQDEMKSVAAATLYTEILGIIQSEAAAAADDMGDAAVSAADDLDTLASSAALAKDELLKLTAAEIAAKAAADSGVDMGNLTAGVQAQIQEAISGFETIVSLIESTTSRIGSGMSKAAGSAKKAAKEAADEEEKLVEERKKRFIETGEAVTTALKNQYQKQYDDQAEAIDDRVDLVKKAQYDEISIYDEKSQERLQILDLAAEKEVDITAYMTERKYDIISEAYMKQLSDIDAKIAAEIEGINTVIQAELERIRLTDAALYEQLIALEEEKKAIEDNAAARKAAIEQEKQAKRIAEFEARILAAETTEEIEKYEAQLADYRAELAEKETQKAEKDRIASLNAEIADARKLAQEKIKASEEIIEAERKKQEELLTGDEGSLLSVLNAAKDELDEWLKEAFADAPKIVGNMLKAGVEGQEAALELLKKFYPEWRDAGKSFIDYFNAGVDEETPDLIAGMTETGIMVMDGFLEGLIQKEDEIIAEAERIAALVSETIRAAMEINSPSKVMMRLGENVGSSFSMGIANAAGLVKNVSRNLGLDVVSETSQGGRQAAVGTRSTGTQQANGGPLFVIEHFTNNTSTDIPALFEEMGFYAKQLDRGRGR